MEPSRRYKKGEKTTADEKKHIKNIKLLRKENDTNKNHKCV
jgi:hypothetical protein